MGASQSMPTPTTQELLRVVTSDAVGAPDGALADRVAPIAPDPFVPDVSTPIKLRTVTDEAAGCETVAVTDTLPSGAAANARAALRQGDRGFVPQTYDGHVVYVRAEASPSDSTAAWRMVAPHLRVQFVKGDHNTCLTTQVDSLGAQLRGVLREAQGRVPATPATHPDAGADACEIPLAQTHTG